MDAKLNQSDLISLLAKESNISAAKADIFTKNFFEIIVEGLEQDGIVKINGFGTFKVTEVASRGSVNVNTGEKIEIKGHRKLSFTPAETLKENVNQPFAMFEPVEVDETYKHETANEVSEHEEALAESVIEKVVSEEVRIETVDTTPAIEENVEKEVAEDVFEEQAQQVVETAVSEPVVVQPRPAEPVLVRVPAKKKPVEVLPNSAKKRSERRRYTIITIIAIVLVSFVFSMISKNEPIVDVDNKSAAVQVQYGSSPVRRIATDTVPNTATELPTVTIPNAATDVVPNHSDIETEIIPNAATDVVPNHSNVETEIISNAATDVVPNHSNVETEIIPNAATDVVPNHSNVETEIIPNAATDVVPNHSDIETEIIVNAITEVEQNVAADEEAADEAAEEPYSFVMLPALASKSLQEITYADTALYDADGDFAIHTVAPDETLTRISRIYYNDKKLWPYIVKYNNIYNPDTLYSGMTIRIPRLFPKE